MQWKSKQEKYIKNHIANIKPRTVKHSKGPLGPKFFIVAVLFSIQYKTKLKVSTSKFLIWPDKHWTTDLFKFFQIIKWESRIFFIDQKCKNPTYNPLKVKVNFSTPVQTIIDWIYQTEIIIIY